jgi:hypothetical protein
MSRNHKARLALLLFVATFVPSLRASVPVTGTIIDVSGSPVSKATYAKFDLVNCTGVARFINNGGVIPYRSKIFRPNAQGQIAGTILTNNEIECDGQQNSRWRVSYYYNNVPTEAREFIVNADLNLNTATPLIQTMAADSPYVGSFVQQNPTGDQTIAQPNGTKLYVTGDSQWNGNITITGNATLNDITWIGDFTAPANLTVTQNTNILGTLTVQGATTFNGSISIAGLSLQSLNTNIIFADRFAGADGGAKINAAIAAADVDGAVIDATNLQGMTAAATITVSKPVKLLMPCGTVTLAGSPGINITAVGAKVQGCGMYNTYLVTSSGTADVIQTNGAFWQVEGLTFRSSVARTNGAGLRVKSGNGWGRDLRFERTYNGIQITDTGSGGNFHNIQMGSGGSTAGSWNAGILIGGVATGTVTSSQFTDIGINASHAFADAMVSIKEGSDAIVFEQLQAVTGGANSIAFKVWDGGAGGGPAEWIKCNSCLFEAGTGANAVDISSGRHIEFANSYIATSLKGLYVHGTTVGGIVWRGGEMVSIQQNAIHLAAGTTGAIEVDGVHIADVSQALTNTHSGVLVDANIDNFRFNALTFANIYGVINPKYCIEIIAGTSNNWEVTNNKCYIGATGNYAVAGVSGAARHIWGNYPYPGTDFWDVRSPVAFNGLNNAFNYHTNFNSTASFAGVVNFNGGIAQTGTGVKHARVAGCATAASIGATCDTTVTWAGTAFADTNYTVTCSGQGITTGVPRIQSLQTKAASSITVRSEATTAAAAQFALINCVAMHD